MDFSASALKVAADQAKRMYAESIREQVEPEHVGEFLVIDLGTGAFVLGTDRAKVSEEAKIKFPDAVRYLMRIGYPAAIQIGALGCPKW